MPKRIVMKTRLVMWGQNAQDKKVLLAIGLKEKENKVDIFVFPEEIATEDFYNILMNQWRNGEEVAFPEGHEHMERPLTVSESILPEELKVDRGDVLIRAQAEWHFVVLSSKLHESYKEEIDIIKDKVHRLEKFEQGVWEELKGFWEKVQAQAREKNLFRDHADEIKQTTNELFAKLKEKRKKLDDEFKTKSKEFVDEFMEELDEIKKKLDGGLSLKPIFDDLKKLQRKLKDTAFTKEHRRAVWQRIDNLFKEAKGKRGDQDQRSGSSGYDRVKRRLDGLLKAIDKMEHSIKRDKKELNFQNKRIATTDGQLEAQLRQAKLVMIEQRIKSKEDKLSEMEKTKVFLQEKLEKEAKKLEKLKEKEEVEKAKEQVKDKIQEEIEAQKEVMKDKAEELKKAAEAIKESKGKKSGPKEQQKTDEGQQQQKAENEESFIENVEELIEDTLEDVVDSVKAVATVVSAKVSDFVEDLRHKDETTQAPSEEPNSEPEKKSETPEAEQNSEEEE